MNIIENSNIVNWSIYPDFICAVVGKLNSDCLGKHQKTGEDLIIPVGTEFIFLVDKMPKVESETDCSFHYCKVHFMEGIRVPGDGEYDWFDVVEIHIKPRPVTELKEANKRECEA